MTIQRHAPRVRAMWVPGPVLLILGIAGLFLMAPHPSSAATFGPTASACFTTATNPDAASCDGSSAPGAKSNIFTTFELPLGDANFDAVISFTPSAFAVPAAADVPLGAIVGRLNSIATLGLINGPCASILPVNFALMNASVDINDTIDPLPYTTFNNLQNLAQDADGSGVPDGAQKYPSYLNTLFKGQQPRARYFAATSLTFAAGQWVIWQFVTFEAGTSPNSDVLPALDARHGYPSVTVLQDPTNPPSVSAVTDICSSFRAKTVVNGESEDNANTGANEAGFTVRTNPTADGTYNLTTWMRSQRDADGDGFENGLDTCPYATNVENPRNSPAQGGDPDLDGVDSACDPDPGQPCQPTSTDCDGDQYPNRGDNCPLVPNADQKDEDQVFGTLKVGDGIGDTCDFAVGTLDGHYHVTGPCLTGYLPGCEPGGPAQCLTSGVQVGIGGPVAATDFIPCGPPHTPLESSSGTVVSGIATTVSTATGPSDGVGTALAIPADAAPAGTVVTINEFSSSDPALPPPPVNSLSRVVEFTPEGQVFTSAVTIVFRYTDAEVVGKVESSLAMHLLTGGAYVAVADCTTVSPPAPDPCVSARDPGANTVTVVTTHLSVYALSAAATGTTITVNTTTDELNADGDCSLREAIQAANTNTAVDACPAGDLAPAVDDITFSVTGTITITRGQLAVSDDLTIDGPGAANLTISGNNASRVFDVSAGTTVHVRDLTLVNGSAVGADGGGIRNAGTLTVTSTTFSQNAAAMVATIGGGGGGIFNSGALTVTDSTFSENSALTGGGITSFGPLTVTNSTFSGNSASSGGGIDNVFGAVVVSNSTFSGNSAVADVGGGILSRGTLTVTDTTFSGNSAALFGGGGGIAGNGTITVTNSTFTANSTQRGGGILNGCCAGSGTLTITNTTFSGNSAGTDGGGGIHNADGTVTITNATFAGNSAGELGGGAIFDSSFAQGTTLRNTIVANGPSGRNCFGVIIDGAGNLQHPGTDCGATIPSADPLLDPAGLQNNGGPTQTIALQPGSPAIDTAVLPNCPPADQRGVSRPQSAGCDIGAFELAASSYDFAGFFSPIDNPPVFNSVKAGAGVPVKFSLGGDQGLDIFATGYPRSQRVDCDTSTSSDAIEETVTAGSSSLAYDPAADQYVYVWKTSKAWEGTCRELIVRLSDNTDHTANFRFK